MARKRSPYAEDINGNLFVLVTAIMHPLVPFIDGLTLHYFGTRTKLGPAYLPIDRAIAWLKEESKYNAAAAKALVIMEQHQEQFLAEKGNRE